MTPPRILVVDDEAGMRRALVRVLSPSHEVEAVTGVTEALERITEAAFDLALVDIRLADGDGYQLCQQILAARPDTDVILMTGSVSEPDEKLYRSLEEGAFYFLFKPFDRRVLLALVERCLRLKRERETKELYAATLAADLERARLFQHSLLPRRPLADSGWTVEGRLRTCDALGGDLYVYQAVGAAGVVTAVADVVGHGVGAAMVAGMLRSTLDAARRRSPEPEDVAPELMAGFDVFRPSTFATVFYALLGPAGGVCYFNAGHPPAFVQSRDGAIAELPSTGFFLSRAFRDRPPKAARTQLEPGDRLFLYSDGAFELRDPGDRELGLPGLRDLLVRTRSLPVGEALDQLLAGFDAHLGGRPLDDDVTLLLVERAE
jgi:sigma-B regulation protein RsbU (phosphoserine phosphatase)